MIAFLGLGNMGGPMAANLVTAGHDVTGYDPVTTPGPGITPQTDEVAAARDADVVLTMLPSGRHLLDCYAKIIPVAKPGTLFVDCSTVDVADARTAATMASEAGHLAVDAPVSGGVVGAEAGSLTFMAGGADEAIAKAEPVLLAMGARVIHCGQSGSGQAAKICNNMILGISMIAVSEGFALAEQLGLSHQALFDVASTSSGQCWSLTTNCPVPGPVPASPANRDYRGGFASALMLKDLRLAQAAAGAHGVETTLGEAARQAYESFVAQDGGKLDFSAIVTAIRKDTP